MVIESIMYLLIIFLPSEDVLYVWTYFGDCSLAFLHFQECQHDDDGFEDEDEHADEDGEIAEACFLVIIAAPSHSPVNYPHQINYQGNH